MLTFDAPLRAVAPVREKFAKIEKKAAKFGLPVPTLAISESWTKERKIHTDAVARTVVESWVTVTISNDESVVLPGGWTFLGTITPTDEGNLVTVAPARIVPDGYRQGNGRRCDHCLKIRARKATYVIQNADGETKQIGANCVRDFLGGYDPKALETYGLICDTLREVSEEREWGGSGGRDYSEGVHTLTAITARVVRVKGWLSKGEAETRGKTSTADNVTYYLYGVGPDAQAFRREIGTVEDIDNAEAEAAIQWAKDTFAADGTAPSSDYLANLRVIVRLGRVEPKFFGLAVSLLSAHKRAQNEEITRAAAATGQYVGTVGVRETFTLTVVDLYSYDTQFGRVGRYTFADAAGNLLVWKASANVSFEKGDTVTGKATVKEWTTDRKTGGRVTMIARASLTQVATVAA